MPTFRRVITGGCKTLIMKKYIIDFPSRSYRMITLKARTELFPIFINAFSITHSFSMLLIVSKAYPLRKPDKLTATPGCENRYYDLRLINVPIVSCSDCNFPNGL